MKQSSNTKNQQKYHRTGISTPIQTAPQASNSNHPPRTFHSTIIFRKYGAVRSPLHFVTWRSSRRSQQSTTTNPSRFAGPSGPPSTSGGGSSPCVHAAVRQIKSAHRSFTLTGRRMSQGLIAPAPLPRGHCSLRRYVPRAKLHSVRVTQATHTTSKTTTRQTG